MKAIAVSFLLCLSVSFGQDRQPNVVVILTDDQGWGDLSLHGNTNLSTPNIDAMAKGGAQFDRFLRVPCLLANSGGVSNGTLSSSKPGLQHFCRGGANGP